MHTHHIHNINSHMIALVTQSFVSVVSLHFDLYLSLCQAASFYKGTSFIYFLVTKSGIPSVSGPEMSLIISPLDFGNSFFEAQWILANTYETLSKSRVDSRKCLSKSRVDSRKCYQMLIKSRVDSRKCLSKAEWILANAYQKPSGFSRMLTKAEWILANVYQKSSGFSRMLIKSRVDSRECLSKAEWILANIYQKPSGFSRMLIKSRVDSRKCFTMPSGFSQILC